MYNSKTQTMEQFSESCQFIYMLPCQPQYILYIIIVLKIHLPFKIARVSNNLIKRLSHKLQIVKNLF